MNYFRFRLEPYCRGGANRYQCPHCGDRTSFTRYIDTETHLYIADECGCCNHKNRCGYHLKPREYFRLHPENRPLDWKEQLRRTKAPDRQSAAINVRPIQRAPMGILPDGSTLVQRYHSPASTLAGWLSSKVKDADFRRVYEDYRLGATAEGDVIYWQIDEQERVRTGKLMSYHPDGHRDPDRHPRWMHNYFPLPKDTVLSQCLYGQHLLRKYPDLPVALVESEKTALVCSALLPQHVWLATGGCKALNADRIQVLKGRNLTVCPDSGCYDQWKAILDSVFDGQYHILDLLEKYPGNTDLADILMSDVKMKSPNQIITK